MTLSYSLGLTLGSASAYLLNTWLGPHGDRDPCNPVNSTAHNAVGDFFWANSTAAFYDLPPNADIFPG